MGDEKVMMSAEAQQSCSSCGISNVRLNRCEEKYCKSAGNYLFCPICLHIKFGVHGVETFPVFVKGLPADILAEDLHECFEQLGFQPVHSAEVFQDIDGGNQLENDQAYGVIKFFSQKVQDAASRMKEICIRPVLIVAHSHCLCFT